MHPSWPQVEAPSSKGLPQRWEKHPVEGCADCNTYFYSPENFQADRRAGVLAALKVFEDTLQLCASHNFLVEFRV
jgi:hypothetical protein